MKKEKPKRIAIYTRVSTQEQTTLNQQNTLVQYANSQGWSYEIFSENQSTRKTRPVKQELLAKLRKAEYDGVIVYKLDRWARSVSAL